MTSPPLFRSRPTGFDIQPASQTEAKPINDFIYVSEGLSNSYLVVTSEGRVVINTGMGFEGPTHKKLYDSVDAGPTRYIILTQGHVDHVGGVDAFLEEGTEVVAQENNATHQQDDARISKFRSSRSAFAFAKAIGQAIAHAREKAPDSPIPAQSVAKPTLTFEDELSFELGGVRFELYATPGGETRDSLIIWLPQHKICFAGNLFSALFGHFPNLVTVRGDRYREALEFIPCLERVRDLEPELLLVGHHAPISGRDCIRDELTRLRDAVQSVHDQTVTGMNAGKDVRTLMREVRLPEELEVGEGYGKISWSVRAIWETYAGWFHHESTTELYPVPASSVHVDLVELAGGSEVIAARARERADKGDFLEAIHLAEIVLSAEPHHSGAIDASLRAHEGLEKQSENFWETSWLRKQQAELNAQRSKG